MEKNVKKNGEQETAAITLPPLDYSSQGSCQLAFYAELSSQPGCSFYFICQKLLPQDSNSKLV